MTSPLVVVRHEPPQHAPQVSLDPWDDVVRAITAPRPDHALGEPVAPRAGLGCDDILDGERTDVAPKHVAENRVPVADEVRHVGNIKAQRLGELLADGSVLKHGPLTVESDGAIDRGHDVAGVRGVLVLAI